MSSRDDLSPPDPLISHLPILAHNTSVLFRDRVVADHAMRLNGRSVEFSPLFVVWGSVNYAHRARINPDAWIVCKYIIHVHPIVGSETCPQGPSSTSSMSGLASVTLKRSKSSTTWSTCVCRIQNCKSKHRFSFPTVPTFASDFRSEFEHHDTGVA